MPQTMVTVPRMSHGVTDSPRKITASIVAKSGAVLNNGVARATPAIWMLTALNSRPSAKLKSPLSAKPQEGNDRQRGKHVPVEYQRQPHNQDATGKQR